jgi:hypothetical protein
VKYLGAPAQARASVEGCLAGGARRTGLYDINVNHRHQQMVSRGVKTPLWRGVAANGSRAAARRYRRGERRGGKISPAAAYFQTRRVSRNDEMARAAEWAWAAAWQQYLCRMAAAASDIGRRDRK